MLTNKYIFLTLLALCISLSFQGTAQEETNPKCEKTLSKAEKRILKLLSPKKQQQVLEKLKENLTPEKQAKLIDQIADSSLSDTQKVGLVEALDSVKNQVELE